MAENIDQTEETVVLSDLSDSDVVIKYCLENKISKDAIDELLKRGFTSLEALQLVEMGDLVGPKIPKGQRRLILHIAAALKGTASSTTGGGSTDSTAVSGATTETTEGNRRTTGTQPAPATVMPENTQVDQANPANGVHSTRQNDNADIYHSAIVNNLIRQQQGLQGLTPTPNAGSANTSVPSLQPQVSWSDPQVHISSAAGKSSSVSYLDICDFVQTNVEEEVVLGSQGDQQFVVKSGPKKPRLENLTLSQWSVANLAILYRLVGDNKLQGPALMDYLSYSTKVYQLVQRYSLVSVLLFDREYRKLQATMQFRWGTDVQHLSNIHLQSRERPVAQGNQPKKSFPAKPSKNVKTKPDKPVCRNFNSQKGCSFNECNYRHVCIIPGCGQSHSAVNHSAAGGKN